MRASVMVELVIGLAALGWVGGCGEDSETGGSTSSSGAGGSSSSTSSGTGGQGGSSSSSSGFDPNDPGIHVFLNLGSALMMGQTVEFALAGFMPAAREDFEEAPPVTEIPIDTCQVHVDQPPTPSCTNDEECAPEQDCLPDNDDNGSPIPGTEHCVTPRELMDVGAMTVTGFTGGPTELVYNPGQSGAYTVSGTDGSLPSGTLAYDTTYTFSGAGDPGQGLGAFTGEVDLPAAVTITAPPLVELGMPGVMGIEVNPAEDLALEWSGSTGGELNLNMASTTASIDCRITDDGSFTIPAAMVQAVGLGEMAFFNILSLDRRATGTASGEGISYHDIGVIQTVVLNVGLIQ